MENAVSSAHSEVPSAAASAISASGTPARTLGGTTPAESPCERTGPRPEVVEHRATHHPHAGLTGRSLMMAKAVKSAKQGDTSSPSPLLPTADISGSRVEVQLAGIDSRSAAPCGAAPSASTRPATSTAMEHPKVSQNAHEDGTSVSHPERVTSTVAEESALPLLEAPNTASSASGGNWGVQETAGAPAASNAVVDQAFEETAQQVRFLEPDDYPVARTHFAQDETSHDNEGDTAPLLGASSEADISSAPNAVQRLSRRDVQLARPSGGWKWERDGSRRAIIRSLIEDFQQPLATVGLLIAHVLVYRDREGIMSCRNARDLADGLICEWTKAHVFFFPLIALLLTVVLMGGQALRMRLYYQLLKRGALMDFTPMVWYRDPLFLALLFNGLNAFLHFAIKSTTEDEMNHDFVATTSDFNITDEGMIQTSNDLSGKVAQLKNLLLASRSYEVGVDAHAVSLAFLFPACVFLFYISRTYDISSKFVSLSRFFVEDPEMARHFLAKMHYVDEFQVKAIIESGELFRGGTETRSADDVVFELISRAGTAVDAEDPKELTFCQEHFVRAISQVWPAGLLLDMRMTDAESKKFRHFWYVFSFLCDGMVFIGAVIVGAQAVRQCLDFSKGYSQQIAGALVLAGGSLFSCWVLFTQFVHAKRCGKWQWSVGGSSRPSG
mmetsp:Transcript_34400/g.92111  ORF Transcript_34400/g.92111 Transcript_34400/m.92111 type:complete len:669 (-) Transcript_34400:134-2140(-)